MEQNVPVMTKRVWSIVKAVLFMMRKGLLSKRKLMVDLNVMLKRGKIAGAKAIGNLMFHHHSNRQVSSSSTAEATATAVQEYEFSCSNTPNYIFPFNLAAKKKNSYYHHFFACTHAPPTLDDDNVATMNALKVALEMINKNDGNNSVVAASPMLPGFGQTPLARQLRIMDSPFPLRDMDEDADYVDKAAEDFINRFYKDLKQQTK
ncbi:hypothetical protein ERO13_D05G133300v2 [Gossypium hirsutum]|uniref:Avr9/Cf-9 rapidly elicited protein 146 n=1 Tax=Gossypium hirsutum TaxID=3635 RepID=A0A1U8JDW4_GOSHI|nr:uncharacterized protein LOC107906136 [Gossypium hirsutum]KAG4146053.1 hypothetical protein ERO13_D05G133300v2 [Gossypium hirsutum]